MRESQNDHRARELVITRSCLFARENRYYGSERAAKFIHYRIAGTNNLVSPDRLAELRKENHRPGLLAEVWKGEE
jgi:hypothetical protein